MKQSDSSWHDQTAVFASPRRTMAIALSFVGMVAVIATLSYMAAGWSLADALYMVTLTVFSVGYREVHSVDTPFLRAVTITTIVMGCTGMIMLTGALVQLFTAAQISRIMGIDRMQAQIEKMAGHVIICGFGRIGLQLAKELSAARRPFVILERDPVKFAQAEALDYLVLRGDATDEDALRAGGVDRAEVLATVLPDDAANVFITLSARNLNPRLQIIARGEAPSTETKLYHAGASKVIMPTHIGAERIAEIILYPATSDYLDRSEELTGMKRGLHELGLEIEIVDASAHGAVIGETVAEAERRSGGAFFIVRIDRANGQSISAPAEDTRIESGDRIILVMRGSRVAAGGIFTQRGGALRSGRLRH